MFKEKDFDFFGSIIINFACVNVSGILMDLSFILAFTSFAPIIFGLIFIMFFCFLFGWLFKKHIEYLIKKDAKDETESSIDRDYVNGIYYLNYAIYFLIFIFLSIQFIWNIYFILQNPLTYIILFGFMWTYIKGLVHLMNAIFNSKSFNNA